MKVELIDKYHFIVSKDSFDLYRATGKSYIDKKSGKDYIKDPNYGYFTSISRLINRVTHLLLSKKEETVSLTVFLASYTALQDKVIAMLPSTLKDGI